MIYIDNDNRRYKESELKSCPLCGEKVRLVFEGNLSSSKKSIQIFCPGCCLRMKETVIIKTFNWLLKKMIARWNNRIDEKECKVRLKNIYNDIKSSLEEPANVLNIIIQDADKELENLK